MRNKLNYCVKKMIVTNFFRLLLNNTLKLSLVKRGLKSTRQMRILKLDFDFCIEISKNFHLYLSFYFTISDKIFFLFLFLPTCSRNTSSEIDFLKRTLNFF